MIRTTRRAALVTIGAGATLLATDTLGFSKTAVERSTAVDVVGDEDAYVALEGLREGEQYEEPHASTFANNVDDDVDIELSVGPNYVITDADPGINDGETVPPDGSASATIERDGGEEAPVEATVQTPDEGFTVNVSRTLSLSATEPDETDARFRIWLDADDPDTMTTSEVDGEERVDSWGDRSDITGSADATADATAPAYENDWATNANDVVRFADGEYLSPSADVDLTDERELTLFVALDPDDDAAANGRPVSLSNPDDDRRIYFDYAAGEAFVQIGDDAVAPPIDLSAGPLVATLLVKRDGDLGDLQATTYRNGAEVGTEGTSRSESGDATLGSLPLGVGAKHDGSEPFAGDVGETLLFESAFGEDDRVDVEDYLIDKWDVNA